MDWQALIVSQPALAVIPQGLRRLAEPCGLAAGETLFRIGDPVHGVFAVIHGEIRLLRRDRKGTEIVLQRSRGGFFAEASLACKAYHCDAVSALKSTVLRFPLPAFRSALDADADFRDAWMNLLAREVRKLRSQCERMSLRSAADRIVHYIESEGAHGVVRLNQSRKAWAAELGLTHEALYRALRRLQEVGGIEVAGDSIAIVQSRSP